MRVPRWHLRPIAGGRAQPFPSFGIVSTGWFRHDPCMPTPWGWYGLSDIPTYGYHLVRSEVTSVAARPV